MRKIFLIACLFFGFIAVSNAQSYSTAIGFRGGLSTGLTVKHFMEGNKALEGILTSRWNGWNITGLVELEQPLDVDGLSWFYGFGAHIGFWDANNNRNWFGNSEGAQTVLGIDGIIGLEFTIPNAPLNFQLDYKPGFNLIGHSGYWGDEAAISIRYAIK